MHLVAPALERPAVNHHLGPGAGVNVINTPLYAATNDIIAVLLKIRIIDAALTAHDGVDALPVTAQADGRDLEAGPAQAPVFHIRVVIERF